jgi:hypothetical protein
MNQASGLALDADALAKVEDEYVEATLAEKKKFGGTFESVNKAILKKEISADEKLAAARVIEREQRVFEEKGYLPLSTTMWESSVAHVAARNAATKKLVEGFDGEIEVNLRAKNLDAAESLQAAKKELLYAEPMFVVDYHGEPKKIFVVKFYGGGLTDRDGVTWTMDSKAIVVKWKDAKVKGGYLIDTFTPEADGLRLEGRNQLDNRKAMYKRENS